MNVFRVRAAQTCLSGALLCFSATAAADEPRYNLRSLSLGGNDSSVVVPFNALDQIAGAANTASFDGYYAFFHDGATLYDIGTLDGPDSQTFALNDAGQVVGYSNAPDFELHAFSWTRSTGIVDLGTLGGPESVAVDVNDLGQVVGGSTTNLGELRAFSWTQGGGLVNLGTLGGGSQAVAINDAGQILGMFSSDASNSDFRVFLWTPDDGMSDLGMLGDTGASAALLTQAGQVVGHSGVDDGASHAFSWTAATGMIDLGTFGGSDSFPAAVNEAGQVIGFAHDEDGTPLAFSWTSETGLVELTLGGNSTATAINAAGQVVGWSNLPGDEVTHAFSWTLAGGIVDLGTLGGEHSMANAINDAGQIVGWSTDEDGNQHAFLWTARDGMLDLNDHLGNAPNGAELFDAVAISTNGSIIANSPAGHVLLQPSSGDVTGGGWFESPAGAYPSGATVAGRATFGFVARHNNGHAGAPNGHVELKLGAAPLSFRSDNFESLFVAGARAGLKGTGVVNGSAGYEFIATAIDGANIAGGASDRFRIRIWRYDPVLEQNVVVYDNQLDPATVGTLNEGTPTAGGNIAIHP